MQISSSIREKTARAEEILAPIFSDIDRIARENTEHVLDCFREAQVSEALFAPSTGYGYGDVGRDRIDALAAAVFRAPAGFMRPSLLSGTHTLTVALFGILRWLLNRGHKVEAMVGADDGTRTRHIHLGKVALYQMSYIRR